MLWFVSIIPENIIRLVTPVILIIVGYLVEKRFIGRVSLFTNTIALNIFLYSLTIPNYLMWYANIGMIAGIIGIFSYAIKYSLPTFFYILSYIYSSIPVGLIILYYTLR